MTRKWIWLKKTTHGWYENLIASNTMTRYWVSILETTHGWYENRRTAIKWLENEFEWWKLLTDGMKKWWGAIKCLEKEFDW